MRLRLVDGQVILRHEEWQSSTFLSSVKELYPDSRSLTVRKKAPFITKKRVTVLRSLNEHSDPSEYTEDELGALWRVVDYLGLQSPSIWRFFIRSPLHVPLTHCHYRADPSFLGLLAQGIFDVHNRGLTDTKFFTEITEKERSSVSALLLQGNALSGINISVLRDLFPNLKTLDLSHNPLREIKGTAIDGQALQAAARAQNSLMQGGHATENDFKSQEHAIVSLEAIKLQGVASHVVAKWKRQEKLYLQERLRFGDPWYVPTVATAFGLINGALLMHLATMGDLSEEGGRALVHAGSAFACLPCAFGMFVKHPFEPSDKLCNLSYIQS